MAGFWRPEVHGPRTPSLTWLGIPCLLCCVEAGRAKRGLGCLPEAHGRWRRGPRPCLCGSHSLISFNVFIEGFSSGGVSSDETHCSHVDSHFFFTDADFLHFFWFFLQ